MVIRLPLLIVLVDKSFFLNVLCVFDISMHFSCDCLVWMRHSCHSNLSLSSSIQTHILHISADCIAYQCITYSSISKLFALCTTVYCLVLHINVFYCLSTHIVWQSFWEMFPFGVIDPLEKVTVLQPLLPSLPRSF